MNSAHLLILACGAIYLYLQGVSSSVIRKTLQTLPETISVFKNTVLVIALLSGMMRKPFAMTLDMRCMPEADI